MNEEYALGFLGVLTTIFMGFQMFTMKQIIGLRAQISKLCERIATEETKSKIYHENHDLEDK